MPSRCAECGGEFFPQDTRLDCLRGLPCGAPGVAHGRRGRERMPMKRAADRNADLGDVTITVQPAHRHAA